METQTTEELLERARQYLIKAKLFIKEHPVEEFIKLLVFSLYVYYKGNNKLLAREKKEFKDLFSQSINLINLDQRIKEIMPDPLIYDAGSELALIDTLKHIPNLLKNNIDLVEIMKEQELAKAKEDRLKKALNMIHKNRFDGALSQFTKLSDQFPNDYELHKDISWKLYEVKHIECITFLEKTIKLNPYDAESHAALGQVFRRIKKFEESIECYLQALAIEVDNTTYMFNLARVYIESRQWDNARDILSQLLEVDPDMVLAQQALNFVSTSLKGGNN